MPGALLELYQRLFDAFGPQHWWPAETPVEVMAGAILTQNTNWRNVERAIQALKAAGLLRAAALAAADTAQLSDLIRPAGYYRVKASRLKSLFQWFAGSFDGNVGRLRAQPPEALRARLLAEVRGVGHETADSILLYALGMPVFVVDGYTRRILARHGLAGAEAASYEDIRRLFERQLPREAGMYNEYHALLVAVGKRYCRRKQPECAGCPAVGVSLRHLSLAHWPASGRVRGSRRRRRRRRH